MKSYAYLLTTVFFLLICMELSFAEIDRNTPTYKLWLKQREAYNKSQGIMCKGSWSEGVVPTEMRGIYDEMHDISLMRKKKTEQLMVIDYWLKDSMQKGQEGDVRIFQSLKRALQESPKYAGNYKNKLAPYDAKNFSSYYGSVKKIKEAEEENYTFYMVRIESLSQTKQRDINGIYKSTYGKTCYAFLFYDEDGNYSFMLQATN